MSGWLFGGLPQKLEIVFEALGNRLVFYHEDVWFLLPEKYVNIVLKDVNCGRAGVAGRKLYILLIIYRYIIWSK